MGDAAVLPDRASDGNLYNFFKREDMSSIWIMSKGERLAQYLGRIMRSNRFRRDDMDLRANGSRLSWAE
ncbi:hypothetical protein PGTUg99_024483 [Puccinia graminis f. sp. tritici]|uniref:Uncharacterized protein n=1 Tax=Puccinia graminis f. sp. tritici TaxID=56615 RepID=A0A5B0NGJ9_PUCGR|nr:hypothetical protein PGTUg99_024483 [Puccinia graminis f. sp. tritici]